LVFYDSYNGAPNLQEYTLGQACGQNLKVTVLNPIEKGIDMFEEPDDKHRQVLVSLV
jgi:uncharacterized protein YbaP (TraB family)